MNTHPRKRRDSCAVRTARLRNVPFWCGVLVVAFYGSSSAFAQIPSPPLLPASVPVQFSELCTSFDPRSGEFGVNGPVTPDQFDTSCPENQAFFAVRNASGPPRSASKILLLGTCCPVPKDLLNGNHVYAVEQCPEGFVVTGSRQIPEANEVVAPVTTENRAEQWALVRTQQFRCSEINRARYALTAPQTGWNVGWYAHATTAFDDRTSRARIPVALRYGLGRVNRTGFLHHFCVGQPWGSLLTGRTGKYCRETMFGELRSRDGQPIFNFEKCVAVKNPLSRQAECVTESEQAPY